MGIFLSHFSSLSPTPCLHTIHASCNVNMSSESTKKPAAVRVSDSIRCVKSERQISSCRRRFPPLAILFSLVCPPLVVVALIGRASFCLTSHFPLFWSCFETYHARQEDDDMDLFGDDEVRSVITGTSSFPPSWPPARFCHL